MSNDVIAWTLMESGVRLVYQADIEAGWRHGMRFPRGKIAHAATVAESYSDPAAFMGGRNDAVVAWHAAAKKAREG